MDKLVVFLMALLLSIPTSLFAGKRQPVQQIVPVPMATPMAAWVVTPAPAATPRPAVIAQITAAPAPTPEPTATPIPVEQIESVIQGTVRKVNNGFAIIVYNKAELRVNITKETRLLGAFTVGTKLQITHSGEMLLGDLPEITALEIDVIPK